MHAIRHALLVALWIAVPTALLAAPTKLQKDVANALVEEGLTGAVWSTIDSDGTIVTGAAGLKDSRSGRALAADDRVHIGSVTKTLLATGVLRLVTEDRFALDTPVADVLPDVAFDNPWEDTDPIRIRHLLDHNAGLDDLRLWQFFSARASPDTPLAKTFDPDATLLRVRSRPGTRFSYSNMSYTLLGRVIESVTGQRYERYLDAHLLQPLAMHDSTFAFVSQQGPAADPRLAMGHFDDGTAHAAIPTFLRPAGQFTTTARDMARFAGFLMSDGRIKGQTFIAPELLDAMGQPVGTEAAGAGLQAGYGLGLLTRDRHNAVGRCHDGSVLGYHAMLCLFPEQQRAFFVSINTDSETADYGRIDALLIKALEIPAPTRMALPQSTEVATDWEGFYVPAPNRFASFAWLDTVFGFVHVRRHGEALQLRSLQSDARLLVPAGGLLFRAADRTLASHALLTSADGRRILSTGTRSFERTSTGKLVLLWASLVVGALGLLYLLLSALFRLPSRRMTASHPAFIPSLAVLALVLPVPLFYGQSFLQLGDLTPASAMLAAVTAALPLAMLAGLMIQVRRGRGGGTTPDSLAMLAVLQFAIVLGAWGLVPLRLWA